MRKFIVVAAVLITFGAFAAACGDDTGGGDAPPRSSPTPEWKIVDAPIDDYELLIREIFPVQYAVRVVWGLPDGCHEPDAVDQSRAGETITIHVTNRVPDQPDLACTQQYGTQEDTFELGTDFATGTEYRVEINDKVLTFTAQ